MISVFVSSTFLDLLRHREAVREALRQAGFADIAMEDLGAREERPRVECERLAASGDYFVGIYAHRYGHIPDASDVSITECEYRAAASRPRLIYLVHPEHPWNPALIDEGKPAALLRGFKSRLKREHICKEFSTPDNLARHVVADLAREVRRAQLPTVTSDRSDGKPGEWTSARYNRYRNRRFTELVHVIEPSATPGQEFDVSLYLFRHRPQNRGSPFGIDDVVQAEFYLGKAWEDKVFKVRNAGSDRYIGLRVSAYGTFSCLCRITFDDGYEVIVDRYVHFEMEPPQTALES